MAQPAIRVDGDIQKPIDCGSQTDLLQDTANKAVQVDLRHLDMVSKSACVKPEMSDQETQTEPLEDNQTKTYRDSACSPIPQPESGLVESKPALKLEDSHKPEGFRFKSTAKRRQKPLDMPGVRRKMIEQELDATSESSDSDINICE